MPGELLLIPVTRNHSSVARKDLCRQLLPFPKGLYLCWRCFSDAVLGLFALCPPQCHNHTVISSFGSQVGVSHLSYWIASVKGSMGPVEA